MEKRAGNIMFLMLDEMYCLDLHTSSIDYIDYTSSCFHSCTEKYDFKDLSFDFRNPKDQFISSWTYYNKLFTSLRQLLSSYNEHNPDYIGEIEEFLESPHELMKNASMTIRILQQNPQLIFFGYPSFYLIDSVADG